MPHYEDIIQRNTVYTLYYMEMFHVKMNVLLGHWTLL